MNIIYIIKVDSHDYDYMAEEYHPTAFLSRGAAEKALKDFGKGWPNQEIMEFELEVK